MTEKENSFTPDWVEPPGGTIADCIEERGWSEPDFAKRMEMSAEDVRRLIDGRMPIVKPIAERLERVLGSTSTFWLRLAENFQKHSARLKESRSEKPARL